MTELNRIDIEIGSCKFHIEKAINTRDVERYNTYYARMTRLLKERQEILKLVIIGD